MIVKDFTTILEELAPLSYQESYDNAGLLIGNEQDTVSKILLTIDVTEAVIQEAIDNNADFIISHHPLIFNSLKQINDNTMVGRCIKLAIQNHIAIYACHTNIDSVRNGVNAKICEKLGLQNCRFLIQKGENLGDGMIGELTTPQDAKEFLQEIKKTFNCEAIRHSKILKETIQKVAVCGGSGSFLIEDAIFQDADIYITADIKYHDYFRANEKIILADIGHYESEQYTKDIFYDTLIKKFYNFAFQISKVSTNPINYL